jgi:polysaccharide biosynthesis transport protein
MNVETFPGIAAEATPAVNRAATLQEIIAIFRRRLSLFAAVAGVVLALTVIYTFQQTPRYTATSQVMIDTRDKSVTDVEAVMSGLSADSSVVDTEVEILKSRALAERVVKVLKLDEDPEFNGRLRKPTAFSQVVGAPRALVRSIFASAAPASASGASSEAVQQQREFESVVDGVLGRLTVRRSGLTYVINIGFESESPEKAATIANEFARRYLLEQLEAKFEATQQASGWLNERLVELRGQVQTAENAVAAYRAQAGLMSAVGSSLTEQEVSQLNQQLALNQAAQAEREARLRTARAQLASGSMGDDVGEALGSEVVKDLRRQRAEVSRKSAELETRYGEKHPEVLRVQRELSDVDAQIQQEINRLIRNLEAEVQVARQRTGSIQSSLGRARGTLAGNNQAAVRLNELERNAAAVRTLYESFLNRFKETSTQQGMEESDARIVSQAKIPNSQSFPKFRLNLALGLVLGVLAGIGAILVAQALDSGIITAEEAERALGIPSLGAVPQLASTMKDGDGSDTSPQQWVVDKPLSAFAEALRNLKTSIMHSRVDRAVRVVAITSALPGEGKTTTSLCLARTVAMGGSKVVLLDCDLRRRNVNRLLEIEPEVGLVEVLAGTATLEQALVHDAASGAWVLPLAKSAFTPKDLFSTSVMDRLLDELKKHFELIILDTAPVLPVADTRVLAPKADAVVCLARWKKTPRKAIEAALQYLERAHAHVVGTALTQVNVKQQARYGYGDPGYYYRAYKKYYAA